MNTNFIQPQIGTRRSQRRMPTTPSIIERKAIPAKKLMKELPIELSNTTNEDSKKDTQEPEEESEEDEEEILSEESDESESGVNKYAITRARRSPRGQVIKRNEKDKRKISDEKGESAGPQTLLTKIVHKDFSVENYLKFDNKVRALKQEYTRPATYVNCDLRYFNFDFLVDKLGFFDGILLSFFVI
ncbi:MAG: hypothetical protein EOO43_13065 [Flavobacterium sp.]|nr:MAG: hypothetical protein EOO43_13065 [Flavobacterium sp.]